MKSDVKFSSTSSFAVEAARHGRLQTPALVLTPVQTNGRGRRESRWESAAGNLTMTVAFFVPHSLVDIGDALSLLALRVGQTAIDTIQQIESKINLKLKWPNDLVIGDRKAGGILIETVSVPNGIVVCVGIGINVNAPIELATKESSLAPISLNVSLRRELELTQLAIELTKRLIKLLERFPIVNISVAELETILWGRGERMAVQTGIRVETGILEGLSKQGTVLIRIDDGSIREFFNGSLRRANI